MTVIEILLVINLAGLCIYSSITDIQRSVIKNKAILISMGIGTVLNVIYYGIYAREFLPLFLLNFLTMTVLSILMFSLSLWAAGDSKMLIGAVWSIPGRLYDAGTAVGIAPSLSIIITAFSVSFLYVVIESFIERIKNKDGFQTDISLHLGGFIKSYLLCTIYILVFNYTIQYIFPDFYSNNILLFAMLDLFLAITVTKYSYFSERKILFPAAAICVVFLLTNIANLKYMFSDLRVYVLLAAVLFLRMISDRYSYSLIPTKDVQKGMVLSQKTILLLSVSRIKGLPSYTTEDMRSRLSEEEAESIHRWENSKYGQPHIEIVRKLPFAIFITIGIVVLLITKVLGGTGI